MLIMMAEMIPPHLKQKTNWHINYWIITAYK